jgi:hypothetical protein
MARDMTMRICEVAKSDGVDVTDAAASRKGPVKAVPRLAILGMLLSGCGGPTSAETKSAETTSAETPPEETPIALGCEVGIGETHFEPVEDGAEVRIIAGPQGGYHINTAARVFGVDGSFPIIISVTLQLVETGEYLGPSFSVARNQALHGEIVVAGFRSLVNDPQQARGQEITLAIVAEDASGAQAYDARVVVAL